MLEDSLRRGRVNKFPGAYHYTPAVDVWSTGCMFAELCLAHVPKMRALFAGELMQKPNENKAIPPFETDQCHKIFEMLGFPNENLWPEVKHLPKYKELQALAKKHKYPSSSQLKQRVPLGQHISGGDFPYHSQLVISLVILYRNKSFAATEGHTWS